MNNNLRFFILLLSFYLTSTIFASGEDYIQLQESTSDQITSKYDHYFAPLSRECNPETTVIAFDLHEVLFDKKIKGILSSVFKALGKGLIFYAINPCFLYKAMQIGRQDTIGEDMFKQMAEFYPGILKYKKEFYECANSCEPIWPMIEFLKELKEKGFKLFLLSNIGSDSYKIHEQKYPEVMSHFDGIFIPSPENGYIHKPNLDYYEAFKEYLEELNLGDKQIIFIDDIKKNLDGALKCNIAGILCSSTETVKDAFEVLENRYSS